jgi:hypothetical protein
VLPQLLAPPIAAPVLMVPPLSLQVTAVPGRPATVAVTSTLPPGFTMLAIPA